MLERYECGWQITPGDASAMIRLLERLDRDRELLRTAGANARLAFERHYDKRIGTSRILSILGLSETPRIPAAHVVTAGVSS